MLENACEGPLLFRLIAARCAEASAKAGGGEEGIRTLDTTFAVWRFSKALPSATRPPLRCRSYALNRPAGSNRKVVSRVPRGRSTHTHIRRAYKESHKALSKVPIPASPQARRAAVKAEKRVPRHSCENRRRAGSKCRPILRHHRTAIRIDHDQRLQARSAVRRCHDARSPIPPV